MSEEKNFEKEAQEMGGFISKEEWEAKGRDPKDWREPEEFVKRGKEIIPILQDRLDKTEKDLAFMIKTHNTEIEKVRKEVYESTKAQYEEKINELQQRKKEAFEENDWEKYEAAEKQEKSLKPPESPKVDTEKKDEPAAPNKDYEKWHEKNKKWWQVDQDMTDYAIAVSHRLAKGGNAKTDAELYEAVTAEVKRVFPHKFENPNRKEAASVEGDSPSDVPSNKKTFESLPKHAKESYKRFKKRFELQGIEYSKEQYAQAYFAQEAR